MKVFFTIFLVVFFSISLFAQCNCCSERHNQFDFWLGEWEVFDTTGTKVGENSIIELEGGCILSEHWRAVKGGSGRSYNFYNSSDSTWNQTWVDSQGGSLLLKGHGEENKMILSSSPFDRNGVQLHHQITWTRQEDGSVQQRWDVLDTNGVLNNTLFLGIYKKKK